MSNKPKILLIGFGGVGTIVAYTLEHLGRAEVVAVAIPSTYEAIKKGYNIESINYGNIKNYVPTEVELSSKEAMEKHGPFDYIVITTKNVPDVFPVVDMLEDCFDEEKTAVVLIQNGLGIEIPFFKKYPKACVISGVTMINTTLYNDTVKHVSKDTIKFGPFINYNISKELQIEKCKKFVELYSNKNNDAQYEEDVKYSRWWKLVYNSCINTTCALSNLDSGRVELFGGMDLIVRPAMEEIEKVALSEGVHLPKGLIDEMIRGEDGVYYPPSMLIDVRNGNFTEYKNITSSVLKIAKRNHVDVPTLTVLNNLLHLLQYRTMEEKGMFVLPKIRPTKEENYQIKFIK